MLFNTIVFEWLPMFISFDNASDLCYDFGLYEKHSYYDNTYLSDIFILKTLNGLQR